MEDSFLQLSDETQLDKPVRGFKKGKHDSKRLRDIRRILRNEKIKLDSEKKAELESEASRLEVSVNERKKSKCYRKKLNKYLEYKKKKQKTMRFVELVKVKRKINKLQKELISRIESKNTSDIEEIKSRMRLHRKYEDYIRLSPFFKDRKYIPLFSNTQLDSNSISERERFIEDIQDLKEELRSKKCKSYGSKELSTKDSFLLEEKISVDSSSPTFQRKIEYKIQDNNKRNAKNNPICVRDSKGSSKTNNNAKKEFKNKGDNNSKTGTENIEGENKKHIIFSDSE
ncbi:hypothetical protein FG386_000216 [Cryptosporidium ryanae]|uniref:uncharacterized protein n=1 Tax=Cryptosporidium ryanae TaxID=515981 RepID=UPI00351A3C2F|nr:hypothetical protein FG386_000216 [Cryptosporidium ryanae]